MQTTSWGGNHLSLEEKQPKLGLKENFSHLSNLPWSHLGKRHFLSWIFTAFLWHFQIQRFFFFNSSKEQTATKHWVTFSSCCFSVVRKKIWKVLHTLGKIPKFPLPRNTNARKMLRWLQTICTSALFVTRILLFVWGFHCCLLRIRKGIPEEESGINKK